MTARLGRHPVLGYGLRWLAWLGVLWAATWWQLHFLWRRDFGNTDSVSCATCSFDDDIRLWAWVIAVLLAPVLALVSGRQFKKSFGLRVVLLVSAWGTVNHLLLRDRLWGTFSDAEILLYQWPIGMITVVCLSVLLAALPLLWRRFGLGACK